MKTYRIFIDVKAKDKKDAAYKFGKYATFISSLDDFRFQEDPFDDEEEAIILKIARLAMDNVDFKFPIPGYKKELKRLKKRIDAILNR